MKFCLVIVIGVLACAGAYSDETPDEPKGPPKVKEFTTVDNPDFRAAMTSKSHPWSAIGKLINDKTGSWCTGSLVGPDLVLTNRHCIPENPMDLTFYPNFQNGRSSYKSKVSWARKGDDEEAEDWAIIRLNSPLGDQLGWFDVVDEEVSTLTKPTWWRKYILAGYSGDYQRGRTAGVDVGCKIMEETDDGNFTHDCDTFGGASGSPIFAFFKGKAKIVGIHYASGGKKFGVHASKFLDQIERMSPGGESEDLLKSRYSYFHICNWTNEEVKAAIAYYREDSWGAQGWFTIESGECEEIELSEKYGGKLYHYIENRDRSKVWAGDTYRFTVGSEPFQWLNADKHVEGYRRPFFRGPKTIEYGELNGIQL